MDELRHLAVEDLRIGVANPQILKATGAQRAPALRFSVVIVIGEQPIATLDGFRISLGKITPPQTRGAQGGFFSVLVTLNSKWEKLLNILIEPWSHDSRFANIEFPATEAPLVTSA